MNTFGPIWIIVILCLPLSVLAVDYPPRVSWLNDYVEVLTTEQREEFNLILADYEERTSNHVYVGIMRSLPEGMSAKEYAGELFQQWRAGLEGKDNGVLVALFTESRQAAIHVGDGLKDRYTATDAAWTLENHILPDLEDGIYYFSLYKGLRSLIITIEGDNNYAFPQQDFQPTGIYAILNFFLNDHPVMFVVLMLSIPLLLIGLINLRDARRKNARQRRHGPSGDHDIYSS